MKKIEHVNVENEMKVNELVRRLGKCGMNARKLSVAVDVLEEMINDKECTVFTGLAGAMVPAGMKNLIIEMIKNRWIDVLVSTGANLTHDLVEALGGEHLQGSEFMDDIELNKEGYDRMFDVLMHNESYTLLESFFDEHIIELRKADTVQKLLYIIGSKLKEDSILGASHKYGVKIYSPAFIDSGFAMVLSFKRININQFNDLSDFLNPVWEMKKKGFIYLGGGVPKNFIQQSLQFSPSGGADYGVQITMDRVESGGSSGADVKEGISWGKLRDDAKYVDLRADVTIVLPLIVACLKERIKS